LYHQGVFLEEPSVLDYVKSRLAFWRAQKIEIPPAEIPQPEEPAPEYRRAAVEPVAPTPEPAIDTTSRQPLVIRWPTFTLLALLFALIAQGVLEPPRSGLMTGPLGALFYLLALGCLIGAILRCELAPVPMPAVDVSVEELRLRPGALIAAAVLAIVTFLAFGQGVFNWSNLLLWLATITLACYAFWQTRSRSGQWLNHNWRRLTARQWSLAFDNWTILSLLVIVVVLFFRLYHLAEVPPEMVSDHAEKLLDVSDVLNGQLNVFFPRNTGREGFQMYLTAAIVLLFNTGLSFMSLKIGTVLAGLATLPYIYLLGKEVGNRRVGLFALAFAGVAYWPNVISRIALRFALYPLFVAPTLYYFVRGFRRSNRNDIILAGIFLGLGLHGYSPFRIVPLLVVLGVLLFLLHRQPQGGRTRAVLWRAIFWLMIIALISLMVFLPLLRYSVSNPDMFSYRALSRVSTLEKPLDAPAWQIFFQNLWKALIMFAWDDGEVWVVSITHRPALAVVSAALFHLGVALMVARYLIKRNWIDLFLLLSIPFLMLPSILSLAYPAENPILNRTAGAIIPVFILVGMALDSILRAVQNAWRGSWGTLLVLTLGVVLFGLAARQDYTLVFDQYYRDYKLSSWNTSELGQVIRVFSETIGTPDSAWVVAYPHWVDTRLVGVMAGYPQKDYAISPEQLPETISEPNTKLFLLKPEDTQNLAVLRQLYPLGSLKQYTSPVEGKSFLMYFVPNYDTVP
jgi:hypothetical protein